MREHYVCDTEVNLCYSNPCLNGGKCLRKEGGYTCQCKAGFAGQECQLDLSATTAIMTMAGGRMRDSNKWQPAKSNCTGHSSHYQAPFCQLRSRSFYRGSFLTFPALRQRHRLHIKLRYSHTEKYNAFNAFNTV